MNWPCGGADILNKVILTLEIERLTLGGCWIEGFTHLLRLVIITIIKGLRCLNIINQKPPGELGRWIERGALIFGPICLQIINYYGLNLEKFRCIICRFTIFCT
jgi:hypothetical protein